MYIIIFDVSSTSYSLKRFLWEVPFGSCSFPVNLPSVTSDSLWRLSDSLLFALLRSHGDIPIVQTKGESESTA